MYYRLILLIFIFLLFLPLSTSGENIDLSNCNKKKFTVSGYYSATKDQEFYYRGNYKAEIRLNGGGNYSASGSPVFNGMIAAPSNYEYGTKIYFPKYGLGEVQDRGEAIVNAGVRSNEFDRIDIWMGHGQKGLKRALSFGTKDITGYVCDNINKQVGFDFSNIKVFKNFFEATIWGIYMSPGRNDNYVKTMQKYLTKLGYFPANKQTGYFGSITKNSLCNYQVDQGILNSKSHYACGYFGPKTRQEIKQDIVSRGLLHNNIYSKYISYNNDGKLALGASNRSKSSNTNSQQISKKSDVDKNNNKNKDKKFSFKRAIPKGEESREVGLLQKALKELGYYKGDINYKYDMDTINAVYKFQKKYELVDKNTPLRIKGHLGPSTRYKLNNVIEKNSLKLLK